MPDPQRLTLRVSPDDNVAIALKDLPAGLALEDGLTLCDDIPQAHKLALRPISKGQPIVRYGVVLGFAVQDIPAGSWVNEHMLTLPPSPELQQLPFGTALRPMQALAAPPRTTWLGYPNRTGPAGTKNYLGIIITVQCAADIVRRAVQRIRAELLPDYPNVDGVVAITHAYGCGVAIDAPDAYIPIRAIRNIIRHPNFGGEYILIGLGCEKLTFDRLLPESERTPENTLLLQSCAGFTDMMDTLLDMARCKLQRLNERKREVLPLEALQIGMQCGGSDAFSGITANPCAGYAADMLVRGGATVLFSEATEVRDGAQFLAARCPDIHTRDRLAEELQWYDRYLAAGGVGREANTTPGNKRGGLCNIVEKAMGSIAKSGSAPISEVLSPAQRPTKHGLIYASTPASDFVCGACQLASGITLQVFMTGRGTPYSLELAPVVKVSSRDELKSHWYDLIDLSAGQIASGSASVAEIGTRLFHLILDTASGVYIPCGERLRLSNDLCFFNPAPIT